MSDDPTFGAWLKRRRRELDLTQAALAEEVGCSSDMVGKVEGGQARPSRQLSELLVRRLGVPPDQQSSFVQWARTGQRDAVLAATSAPSVSSGYDQGTSAPDNIDNPYKGLRAFGERDAPDFFGRETLTERLMERMATPEELSRFLAVVGPSGSGKSSVVRAGLLPTLRKQLLPGGLHPLIVDIVPGTHPLEEIEAAFLRVAVNPPPTLMEQLTDGERGLVRAVKRVLPADERTEMLLVIDQFEELFTLTRSEQERAILLSGLFEAMRDPHSRLWVVATLRADFYDHPLLYAPSSRLVGRRTEVVEPLTPDQLYRAISGPAERVGLVLEADLPVAIIEDVAEQPGALPLLQYALTELYENREGRLLTLRAYKQSGGVLGSLARRAESLYTGLASGEQAEARQLFMRLVTLGEETGAGFGDTRRRARRSELASAARDEQALGNVLDQFGRYRMLTFDRDPLNGSPTVEVAHEALLRNWPRLREWLDSTRARLLVQRRLMASASEWQAATQEPSFLASGVRLAQFAALEREVEEGGEGAEDAVALTAEERAYLEASLHEQQRQETAVQERQARELSLQRRAANRLRYLVAGLGVFLLLAAVLAGWALNRSQLAQTNFEQADSLRLAGEAYNLLLLHGDPNLIALLSVRSLRTQYSPQADAALSGVAFQGVPPRTFAGHTDQVFAVRFSTDGKYLATGSTDTTVRLWDIATGTAVYTLTGHTRDVDGLAFSPDGKYLTTGSDDGTMRLWDLSTHKTVRTFVGEGAPISWIYFSPDSKYLLTDGGLTPHIWNVATGTIVQSFIGHKDLAWPVFSPDAKYVFTASLDGTARLWDAATGQQIRVFSGPTNWCNAVAYSPDGKYVVAGCGDSSNQNLPASVIRMWDAASGEEIHQFIGAQGVYASAFSADGKYLLTGGEGKVLQLWDVASGQQVRQFSGHADGIYSVAFSPDGQWIASASKDRTAKLWRLQAAPEALVLSGHREGLWSAVFSPDGKYILTASIDKTARLWDAVTGREIRQFVGHTDSVGSAVFSPNGQMVLTASKDRTARLWNVVTGRQVMTFTGHTDGLNRAFFSPDGKTTVTASDDGSARLWEVATGRPIGRFVAGAGPVLKAVFSPNGTTVLTSHGDGTALLWDVATGRKLQHFTGHTGYVRGSFSPTGKLVVTAGDDETARLWDVQTGQEVRRFVVQGVAMWDAEFSPNGKLILTAGNDGGARLWDMQTGQEVRRLTGHTDGIRGVAFSPNGKFILTAGLDKTARLWQTDYHEAVLSVCGQLTRDLTPQERTQYGIADQALTCPAH